MACLHVALGAGREPCGLILTANLAGRQCYYPWFTDEEIGAQKG